MDPEELRQPTAEKPNFAMLDAEKNEHIIEEEEQELSPLSQSLIQSSGRAKMPQEFTAE